jgi:hypothetical protein
MRDMSDGLPISDDLFAGTRGRAHRVHHSPISSAELRAARSLSRRMVRLQSPPDKRRCAHLICESLLAHLRRGAS